MKRFADLLDHRRAIAVFIVATLGISALLLPRLRFMHGMEDFFDRSHPLQLEADRVEEHFVGDRWVFVTYSVDDVFSASALTMVRELSTSIREAHPAAVEDVVSLATLKDAYGGDMTFESRLLVPDPIPETAAGLAEVRRRALRNPVIREHFLGPDGKVAGIAVRFAGRSTLDDDTRARVVGDLRARLAAAERASPGASFYLAGLPIIETDIPHVALRDTLLGGGLMFLLVSGVVLLALRRTRGLGLIVVAVSSASLVGLAMIPGTGGTYNPISSLLLPILTAMCVATVMHFTVEAGVLAARGDKDVRRHTVDAVLKPSLFTIVTTAIGFASLGLSETRSVAIFGWATAAAVLFGGLLAIAIVLYAFSRWPASRFVSPRGAAVGPTFAGILERMADLVIRRKRALMIGSVAVIAVCIIGATRIRAGESNLHYFKQSSPVRQGAAMMEKSIGGSNAYTISIRAADEGAFLEPENLAKLAGLAEFLRDQGGADRVLSIADFLPVMHGAFFGENDDEYRLPDTAAGASQLLLLNTNDRVREYIDGANQWVRVYARTPVHDTGDLEPIFARVEAELAERFPASAGFETAVIGDARIFGLNFAYVSRTQALSLAVCALVIVLLMSLMFRSLTVGLIGLIPNSLPILLIMGVMGWFGIELSMTTAMIGAVTLGIAVDDTIHFIDAYRKRLAEHGDIERAVRETFQLKGAPIVWSSVIFTLGFAVFVVADFTPFHTFAALSSMAMVSAIAGDLIVLPVFLLVFRSRLGVPRTTAATGDQAPLPGVREVERPPLAIAARTAWELESPWGARRRA